MLCIFILCLYLKEKIAKILFIGANNLYAFVTSLLHGFKVLEDNIQYISREDNIHTQKIIAHL